MDQNQIVNLTNESEIRAHAAKLRSDYLRAMFNALGRRLRARRDAAKTGRKLGSHGGAAAA